MKQNAIFLIQSHHLLFSIRQHVQLFIIPVSRLIEYDTDEHKQVAYFEYGILLR